MGSICPLTPVLTDYSIAAVLFSDDAFINPQLAKIFERVRQSADFMPIKQMTVRSAGNPSCEIMLWTTVTLC